MLTLFRVMSFLFAFLRFLHTRIVTHLRNGSETQYRYLSLLYYANIPLVGLNWVLQPLSGWLFYLSPEQKTMRQLTFDYREI